MNKRTKERIEAKNNNGKQYLIYYTGETEYDEIHGKPTRSDVRYQLDTEYNMHIMDAPKKDAKAWLADLKNNKAFADRELFLGDQAPEKRLYDPCDDIEYYGYLTKPNTVGIWMKPNKEELQKYISVLEKQNIENAKKKLL